MRYVVCAERKNKDKRHTESRSTDPEVELKSQQDTV